MRTQTQELLTMNIVTISRSYEDTEQSSSLQEVLTNTLPLIGRMEDDRTDETDNLTSTWMQESY